MTDHDENRANGHKGIYFLPSLFTTAGLFFGFYAIVQANLGQFEKAAVGLLIAMIMDGLDGRIARWTHTTSDFGKEYDSLVDVVAFGLAPALVIYFWSLRVLGNAGWLVAFMYVAATALRLARFNTLEVTDKRYFYGIPCPSAAALIVFWVWSLSETGIDGAGVAWFSAFITLAMAVFMVSNVKFRSFKDIDVKYKIPFAVLLGVVMVFVLVFFDPPRVLFAMALLYALSGPAGWLWRWRKGEESSPAFLPDDDEIHGEGSVEEDGAGKPEQHAGDRQEGHGRGGGSSQ